MWPTVKRHKNISVDSDDPYDKIFFKGLIYIIINMLKNLEEKKG